MSAHLITLKCGLTDPGARPETGATLRDTATGIMPQLWAGARTNLRLVFENPLTGAALSTADWALLTFRLMAEDRTTLYVSKTVVPADFVAGPPKETTIALTTTETTLPEGAYWICAFATLTSGGLQPLAAGPLKVTNGGMLTPTPAEPLDEPLYTQAEVDALLAALLQFSVSGNTLTITNGVSTWTVDLTPASPGGSLPTEDGTGTLEEDGAGNIVHDS